MVADATGELAMIGAQRIVIVDLRVSFFRLVIFFIKAAFALIPAAIIVGFLLMLATALAAAIFGDHSFLARHSTL
jgi:hypothetical protein